MRIIQDLDEYELQSIAIRTNEYMQKTDMPSRLFKQCFESFKKEYIEIWNRMNKEN